MPLLPDGSHVRVGFSWADSAAATGDDASARDRIAAIRYHGLATAVDAQAEKDFDRSELEAIFPG